MIRSSRSSSVSTKEVRAKTRKYFPSVIVFAAIALMASSGCRSSVGNTPQPQDTTPRKTSKAGVSQAGFVGVEQCAACHASEYSKWKGSHHDLAMQPANTSTVLGDFSDATFSHNGIAARFYRREGKFMTRTEGPDRAVHDYEVKYTFGVSPLQQYLVQFPGGRLQALGIAWDSRPHSVGGQRWFHLYPDQTITPDDHLFWTNPDQNWNFMCADCHSTNVRKNYDSLTRSFATSFSEINVACESCHGPGANHVAWARKEGDWLDRDANKGLLVRLDEHKTARWSIDPATGNGRRSQSRFTERELHTCARCHSRRAQIHEDYVHGQPLGDDYRVALLEEDLYYPDGQIKSEDYEYGSFIQSRMFRQGVTCTDCHEPHSLKLRGVGSEVCSQCHAPQKYQTAAHHFHREGSAGSSCIGCHMPTTTYMVIDPRHDHSLRIPRPDLSVALGTPNACNRCHSDRSVEWAAKTLRGWYSHAPIGYQRFAQALSVGNLEGVGAKQALEDLAQDEDQPAIAQASALLLLQESLDPTAVEIISSKLNDPDGLVRRAAIKALSESEATVRARLILPMLADPVRTVRLEAVENLMNLPENLIPAKYVGTLKRATSEYIAAQNLNGDRPEAHMNLALMYAGQRRFDRAQAELKLALEIDPAFVPAAVNLADLYRQTGQDAAAEPILSKALTRSPHDPALLEARGLLMVREGKRTEALAPLGEAARRAPKSARYGYVYAVALNDNSQKAAAIEALEAVLKHHPNDRETLASLAIFYRDIGNRTMALDAASRLSELEPDNPEVQQLVAALRSAVE